MTRFPVDSAEAADFREQEEEARRGAAARAAATTRRPGSDDRAAAAAAPLVHDPGCRDGWLGEDDEGRPQPCPICRPHLWNRSCPTCSTPQSACAGQRERLGVRCCPDCEHRPAPRPGGDDA